MAALPGLEQPAEESLAQPRLWLEMKISGFGEGQPWQRLGTSIGLWGWSGYPSRLTPAQHCSGRVCDMQDLGWEGEEVL